MHLLSGGGEPRAGDDDRVVSYVYIEDGLVPVSCAQTWVSSYEAMLVLRNG